MLEQDNAITVDNVSMTYKLYPSQGAMAADLLGLNKYFFWRKTVYQNFGALKNVSVHIKRGERVGLIGRNGAGKSTLLKLITGNFAPTSGRVSVKGQIQSLMDTGLGFHPEFTGRENIEASLIYNGLSKREAALATEDIIDFVELGDFLDQPIKTYSLGMVARLGFATATAVRPDILIVDEVLSAGDAYFSRKSADRMKHLTRSGTTLLLVSHANSQILQFCERAVWLNQGQVVADGQAMEVVKSYDAFIRDLDEERLTRTNSKLIEKARRSESEIAADASEIENTELTNKAVPRSNSKRSVSRWEGDESLKVTSVRTLNAAGKEQSVFDTGTPLVIEFQIKANTQGSFASRYHIYLFKSDGTPITCFVSEPDRLELNTGELKNIYLNFPSLQLGNGDYVLTVGVYKHIDMNDPSNAVIYDLLDRSFEFKVVSKFKHDQSLVYVPAVWAVDGRTLRNYSEYGK